MTTYQLNIYFASEHQPIKLSVAMSISPIAASVEGESFVSQSASCCRAKSARFPSKLYKMLEYAEIMGLTDVVSWLPHGRAFKIFEADAFMSHVANHFFRATKLRSIHRQLNLWGFKRWVRMTIMVDLVR